MALAPNLTGGYTLASYSNQAGAFADRTVSAVGGNITTAADGTTTVFSGTSSAAPVVAAIAADILSKWPQLSGQQAGQVILATADHIGATASGPDPVFGMGLVDAKAALSPVNPTISNGVTTSSVASSTMIVPVAMSPSGIAKAVSNVTILDQFGRDFTGSIAGLVAQAATGDDTWLRRRLAQMNGGGYADLSAGPVSGGFAFATVRTGPNPTDVRSIMTSGSMSLQSGGTGFHAAVNAQDSLQGDIMGLAPFADGVLAYAPQAGDSVGIDHVVGGSRVGFTVSTGRAYGGGATAGTLGWSSGRTAIRVSLIDEIGSVMGVPSEGALRLGRGATTAMVEAHQGVAVSRRWTIEGYGSVGITRLKIDDRSVVTGASDLIGTRIGFQANGNIMGGLLSFGVAQPLDIERGTARLTLADGYDLTSRSLTYATTTASLAGAQRRVQLTAGYARGTARSGFRIGVTRDLADHSTKALAGWQAAFR